MSSDQSRGEVLDLPPVDDKMERELMGQGEVPPPVAIEVLALGEPSRNITDPHTCHINLGAASASELVGEKTDMSHDHKSSQAHQSSNATTWIRFSKFTFFKQFTFFSND